MTFKATASSWMNTVEDSGKFMYESAQVIGLRCVICNNNNQIANFIESTMKRIKVFGQSLSMN